MANVIIRRCTIFRKSLVNELLKGTINDSTKVAPCLFYSTRDKDLNKTNASGQVKPSRRSKSINQLKTIEPNVLIRSDVLTQYKDSSIKREELQKISTRLINTLEELFKIRPFMALNVLDNNKKVKSLSPKLLKEAVGVCRDFKISDKAIMRYADVLIHRDLREKLEALRELPYPLDSILALANIKQITLLKLITRLEEENLPNKPGKRIQFIAELLQETTEFVCEALVKMEFLRSKNLEKLTEDYKMLLEYGVNREEIKRDLWVFRYSTDHLKERLIFAKEKNVEHIKTWMMRATPEIFETYLKRRSDNKSVLGNSSLIEYLAIRLECPTDFAKYMVYKQPALKNKSMKKMQEIIDFLLAEGFNPIHICRVPKILLHSVETTRKRLKELETEGVHMDSLHILTKSQKQYHQYYEALKKIRSKSGGLVSEGVAN